MRLDFHSRLAVRYMIKMKLSELYGNAFEDFFQDLMCLRYPDFADVRTAGSKGDQGSDGLALVGRKLYACYGPQTFNADKLQKKFNDDLTSALEKRDGQFQTFVFVHNDLRGLHPELTSLLSNARRTHSTKNFEPFGFRKFRDEAGLLERHQVEDLLGYPIPVDLVFGVQLEEVIPLLDHLVRTRLGASGNDDIVIPSASKLDYNDFSYETKEDMRRAIAHSKQIDQYYFLREDVVERDEAALAFRTEYLHIRENYQDPEEILYQLDQYILGNASAPLQQRRAAMVVLAYFFQSCDIFDNPPPDWSATGNGDGQ